MKSAIVKRSIILNGHKTSISLENEFWLCLREIVDQKKTKLSVLLQQIDNERSHANLSSAVRVFILNHMRSQAAAQAPPVLPGPRVSAPMVAELTEVD